MHRVLQQVINLRREMSRTSDGRLAEILSRCWIIPKDGGRTLPQVLNDYGYQTKPQDPMTLQVIYDNGTDHNVGLIHHTFRKSRFGNKRTGNVTGVQVLYDLDNPSQLPFAFDFRDTLVILDQHYTESPSLTEVRSYLEHQARETQELIERLEVNA